MEPSFIQILVVGVVQMIAQCLEAVTGFGSTVLAVPFMAMATPLETAVAIGSTHTWMLVVYVVIISRKDIIWKEFGFIALYVLLGLPIGFYIFSSYKGGDGEMYLKGLLALFMIGVGGHGLYMTWRDRDEEAALAKPIRKNHLMRFILFMGGIVHGAFGTGGPFVVLYAAQALRNKALFRVSLCLLWLSMNSILVIGWAHDGVWTRNDYFTTKILIITLPYLFVGIAVGNWLHHRVSEYAFRLLMYALLFGTGFVVIYGVISKMFASTSGSQVEVASVVAQTPHIAPLGAVVVVWIIVIGTLVYIASYLFEDQFKTLLGTWGSGKK